jgi:alanyl-tRNA synthetase
MNRHTNEAAYTGPWTGSALRRAFLDYFAARDHAEVPSSSLVPHGDPTLLFVNAGMVQFKNVFLGTEQRPHQRAVTSQKCVRAGGKHNDLDSVGRTARHHTFFEMLGNFSFGDYFKREAIGYAWEFLTAVLKLPPERLWVTVYRDDDDAFRLWQEVAGVPAARVLRLGEKDNFWAMGDTGPCGPCSEVVYDRGAEHRCAADRCGIGECDCDRWLELWNLVFMQYERDDAGRMTPLPRPSIDTGMGLERAASVMQGVASNYDTDLLRPLISAVEAMSGRAYDEGKPGFPFRVIADHARTCTFLCADGVAPGNEGQSYVLRRILRRAARYGRALGLERPFLCELVPVVGRLTGDAYPELLTQSGAIAGTVRAEEERFQETLSGGMKRAAEMVAAARAQGLRALGGREAFILYDTYGFPFDLAQDIAEEAGLGVDRAGFDVAMEEQRARGRAAAQAGDEDQAGQAALGDLTGLKSEFVGYALATRDAGASTRVVRVVEGGGAAPAIVVLAETPFYARAGGQVGDTGSITVAGGEFTVKDTLSLAGPHGRVIAHIGEFSGRPFRAGEEVAARPDPERRMRVARYHTATHLLHYALRQVLGDHARQAGSLVAPDRLRFDFTHPGPLTASEVREVEDLVAARVLENVPVETYETSLERARAEGVTALFGEKYGETVRVVKIGDFSRELCGGTHVDRTGQVGILRIVTQEGIGAGVRRVEAVCGPELLAYLREREDLLARAGEELRALPHEVPARVAQLLAERREFERRLEGLESRLTRSSVDDLLAQAQDVAGVRVIAAAAPVAEVDGMRALADVLRDKMKSGAVVLGAVAGDRVNLVAAATPDVVQRGFHAGRLVGEVARLVGGGGGGRADMAQAGGRDPSRLGEALKAVPTLVERQLDGCGQD